MDDLEQRFRRLEDRAAIADLVTRYGFVMDDRDLPGIRRLFSDDAVFRSADGSFASRGIEAIVRGFEARYAELGRTNHVVHSHLVEFDTLDPDRATGLVSSHAEFWRRGHPMVTALRYVDTYVRTTDGWRIGERVMSWMYYADARDYAEVLGDPFPVRPPGAAPRPADWPLVPGATGGAA